MFPRRALGFDKQMGFGGLPHHMAGSGIGQEKGSEWLKRLRQE